VPDIEDEHLLVVNKPAGLNTHAPSPYAGEGYTDWLRHREPRWAKLAIIHRLDKETSGVLVFGKTPLANRSLTAQFTAHSIRKKYLLLTDRSLRNRRFPSGARWSEPGTDTLAGRCIAEESWRKRDSGQAERAMQKAPAANKAIWSRPSL